MDEHNEASGRAPQLTRRQVLSGALAGAALAAVSPRRALAQVRLPPLDELARNVRRALPTGHRILVVRPRDLLVVDLLFEDMILRDNRLLRVGGRPGRLLATFQPQHVAEHANSDAPDRGRAVPGYLAGRTRLAFEVDEDLDYRLDVLLDWSRFPLSVGPAAWSDGRTQSAGAQPSPARPADDQTGIEFPWRLILSPDERAGWETSTVPVAHNGIVELWQARLSSRRAQPPWSTPPPAIRAVWADDFDDPGSPPDERTSLAAYQRREIVTLTSDRRSGPVSTVRARHLALTALGAFADLDGTFRTEEHPAALSVRSWTHVATGGRDQFVKVVELGHLFPFGHRASRIQTSERRVESRGGERVAVLVRETRVVVTEPIVRTPATGRGRESPFETVEMKTLSSPALDESDRVHPPPPGGAAAGPASFWVRAADGSGDVRFDVRATDRDGRAVEFDTPLIFVPRPHAADEDALDRIRRAYRDAAARRRHNLGGQTLSPVPSNRPGDAALDVLEFDLAGSPDGAFGLPFLAVLDKARVRVPGLADLGDGDDDSWARLDPRYLLHGFGAQNTGEVFLMLVSEQGPPRSLGLSLPPERAGGLAAPSFDVDGLSRVGGAVADLAAYAAGTFDPAEWFDGASAKLLGAVSLADVVKSAGLGRAPSLLRTFDHPGGDVSRPPEAVTVKLEVRPVLQPAAGVFQPSRAGKSAALHLQACVRRSLVKQDETATLVEGVLTDATFTLFDVADVEVRKLAFASRDGGKPEVSLEIAAVRFRGDLTFLNRLRSLLASAGAGAVPFSVDLDASSLTASSTLAVPKVQLGVIAIDNIAVTTAFHLPYVDGPARMRFSFAERQRPFGATVSMFGGGGFLSISTGLDGIETLEASLEFGGRYSLDIGVASGRVELMAGLYYRYEEGEGAILAGYIRMLGRLDVLGMVTVSCEFEMELAYEAKPQNRVHGQATVKVRVKVWMFKKTVRLKTSRSFSAGNADPTFRDLMPERDDWVAYTQAFAD